MACIMIFRPGNSPMFYCIMLTNLKHFVTEKYILWFLEHSGISC